MKLKEFFSHPNFNPTKSGRGKFYCLDGTAVCPLAQVAVLRGERGITSNTNGQFGDIVRRFDLSWPATRTFLGLWDNSVHYETDKARAFREALSEAEVVESGVGGPF